MADGAATVATGEKNVGDKYSGAVPASWWAQ
jgi:hypothetical protein